jgi:DNA-binding MarR family transcriptional regulator
MAAGEFGLVAHDFLGSAHVFASAVEDVIEKRILEEVAGKHLTLSQFRLLKLVAVTDAHTISDVGLFLGVSNAAASKAVDKLVRRKLLRRKEGQPDRREICLSLTEASKRLLVAYEEKKERKLAEVFRGYTEEELKRTTSLLDRLSAGLVDHHSHDGEVCLQCGIYFRNQCLVRKLLSRDCFYMRNRIPQKRQNRVLIEAAAANGSDEREFSNTES